MAPKRNRKVIKYRKPLQLNIGVVIFGFIFLYLLYYVFTYFTTEHISVYEVTQGTIAQNTVFEGLILRDETIYYTDKSGYINYYVKDGTKASVGNYIYSIDETGAFYEQMSAMNDGKLILSDESYSQLEQVTNQYLAGYSDHSFHQVYQFKYDMEAALMEALNSNAREEIDNTMATSGIRGLHVYPAENAGVIAYYVDGFESINADTFTKDMFDTDSYKKDNFLQRQEVLAGDAVYKMINSEFWSVIIPIDSKLAKDLAEEENIKVEFKKDNSTAWATSRIINKSGELYLILDFKNSMIRFASDRFVELELLLTDTTGLKIPNSAITTKEFLTVPKEYIFQGGDSDNDGVLLEFVTEDGTLANQFVSVTLFYETDSSYYIDSDTLQSGDVIVKQNSNERYTLHNTEELQGVYNINKGYAVFKRIEKLFENEEYTIIESGTSHGIAMYDHIALDSDSIKEDEIVH